MPFLTKTCFSSLLTSALACVTHLAWFVYGVTHERKKVYLNGNFSSSSYCRCPPTTLIPLMPTNEDNIFGTPVRKPRKWCSWPSIDRMMNGSLFQIATAACVSFQAHALLTLEGKEAAQRQRRAFHLVSDAPSPASR